MQMTDKASIIEKIRALMAMANGTNNENESIAFMNKAQEMLAKHNLEASDIKENVEEVRIDESDYHMTADLSWFGSLAGQVCKMYFCKIVRRKRFADGYKTAQNYYVFIGKEHNRTIAVSMFDYLMKTMHRFAVKNTNNVKDQYEFKKGCAIKLSHRIYAINEANTVKNFAEKSGLPALYNNELALVDQFMSGMGKLKVANRTKISANTDAFYTGSKVGGEISLNNQIGRSATSQHLLK
jgi:type I site-specific restriction-modification system R (restriction) subunit